MRKPLGLIYDGANAETGRTAFMIPVQATAHVSIQVRFIDSISFRQLTPVSTGHGYSVELISASDTVTIGSGATRGLAVHPVGMSLFSSEAGSQY